MAALYFSTRLRQLRTDKHLTQYQVAERVGVTRAMISSYETDIRLPSFDILVKLAAMFGVTTDYLLTMEERRYLDISGLTDREAAAVVEMVSLLMRNRQGQSEPKHILEVCR
jgi:transcriptional regulator with XRE-family HTH domain